MTANVIIFILSVLAVVFITVNTMRKVFDFRFEFFKKHDDKLDKAAIIISVISFILGIFDVVKQQFLGLRGYYIILAIYIAGSIFLTATLENIQKSGGDCSFITFVIKSFTAVMLLEIFLFNFNSYHILYGNYPQMIMPAEYAKTDDEQTSTNDHEYIFENIGIPIGSMTIDADIEGTTSEFMFQIGAADETSSLIREGVGKIWVIPGHFETYTAPMFLSGDVSSISVKVYLPAEQSMTLNSIILNKPIRVHFSFTRFTVLMGSAIMIYAIIRARVLQNAVSENVKFFRILVNTVTVVSLAALTLIMVTTDAAGNGLEALFTLESGNQITQELVDAFESGHTYLTFEPSEKILSMDNPYDTNKRIDMGVGMWSDYKWDHLLYNGKYYSYYGIAPVILLCLPYHLITGYYFPTVIGIYIFSFIGIIALSGVYKAFIERWFNDIPLGMSFIGIIIMLASCGIWLSMARPDFYEMAIAAGFACLCSGAYLFITSNILSDGTISLKRLAFSSVVLSLGVLSRPTIAVYCMCAVLFTIMGYKKAFEQLGNKKAFYFCSAFIPYVLIGGVQMIYNYVRFGSVFDFGIQYSLTINDFVHSQYHTRFVAITIFNFILSAPAFVPEFPFVSTHFHLLHTNGFYYIDYENTNAMSMGLIYRAMPVMAYIFAGKVCRRDKIKPASIVLVFSIIAPLVILFSIWESGYSVRYSADFSWEVLIGAYVIIFSWYRSCGNKTLKECICKAFLFSMFFSLIIDFAQVYSLMLKRGVSNDYRDDYYMFARIFEFWR